MKAHNTCHISHNIIHCMPKKNESSSIKFKELWYIVSRNLFILTNEIIFAVVILLFIYKDYQTGLFLGSVSIINVSLGLFQDIRAWRALENLQMLTMPKVIRIREKGKEEFVATSDIEKGDQIKIKIGDQVPCDGIILSASGLELNEGLITGESNSLARTKGDKVLAGSVITAGFGVINIISVFKESRINRMTEGIKKYSTNVSPIQHSVALVVKYFSFVLVLVLAYVVYRGIFIHEPFVVLISSIATITSMLVPQGLVFAVTLFFAYGAINLFNKKVLLQEVNATEKLGRIKYLCMDKTGTLTQNKLNVEEMYIPEGGNRKKAAEQMAAYIKGTKDSSEIMLAIKKFLKNDFFGEVAESLTFSSWRQYGAVRIRNKLEQKIVFVGPHDIFLSHLSSIEKKWLLNIVEKNSRQGKRILCLLETKKIKALRDIGNVKLTISAVFIFHNDLRRGIHRTINFFQNRGVEIKIISGDNPETTRAIAQTSGIKNTERIITGAELSKWSDLEYINKVKNYTIFAGTIPEQKEKIVAAFKANAYTAMVGDGANDALAIKKADLGIAMFDGAPATRQLASIVLMNNSFAALPGGVELADNIIRNTEIFASMFLNQTFLGLMFFVFVSAFGYHYPFTPLNITFINYFTIGIPGLLLSYWTLWPKDVVAPVDSQPFLKRILPFSVLSSIFEAVGVLVIFLFSPDYLKISSSNSLVVLTYIIFGFTFFVCAPAVYNRKINYQQKLQIIILGILEITFLIIFFHTSFLTIFFDVAPFQLTWLETAKISLVLVFFCYVQFVLARLIISSHKIRRRILKFIKFLRVPKV